MTSLEIFLNNPSALCFIARISCRDKCRWELFIK